MTKLEMAIELLEKQNDIKYKHDCLIQPALKLIKEVNSALNKYLSIKKV